MATSRSSMLLETETVHSIPVLTMAPARAERCPAIFFIHGFGGSKEDGLRLGYQLAQAGFFFISFDAWLHGERYDPAARPCGRPSHGGIYPPESGLDTGVLFFRVIQQCLVDVQTLIDHYAGDPRIDLRHSGVTGLSMGGYASFLIFADIPTVQAAVPMIGIRNSAGAGAICSTSAPSRTQPGRLRSSDWIGRCANTLR